MYRGESLNTVSRALEGPLGNSRLSKLPSSCLTLSPLVGAGRRSYALLFFLLLAGCAGTQLQFKGTVCGEQVDMVLIDRKDRSGFDAKIACGPDGSIQITTSDSLTSAVIASQAELAARLGQTVENLAGKVRP